MTQIADNQADPFDAQTARAGRCGQKKEVPESFLILGPRKAAAAYSPTWCSSTIGSRGFNFSVRDGKRWDPADITTAVYYLREIIPAFPEVPACTERFRAISTGRLNTSLCVHLLPINVVVSHDPIRKSHLGDGFALRCFQRLS